MKNRNFVYDGWKANGFVALACELVLLAGFIALIVWGALRADALQPGGAWMIAGGAAGLLAVVIGGTQRGTGDGLLRQLPRHVL